MKTCPFCNAQLADDAVFCTACGKRLDSIPQPEKVEKPAAPQAPAAEGNPAYQQQPFTPPAASDNRKTYSILAYISILWLFGLLSAPEKFDKRVRFNVGQGIMATIASAACWIVATILTTINNAIFRTEISYFGYSTGSYTVSAAGSALNTLIWLAVSGISLFFMVYGIVKVSKDKDTYLPIIGKFAFYK